jgi:hypothetical protein
LVQMQGRHRGRHRNASCPRKGTRGVDAASQHACLDLAMAFDPPRPPAQNKTISTRTTASTSSSETPWAALARSRAKWFQAQRSSQICRARSAERRSSLHRHNKTISTTRPAASSRSTPLMCSRPRVKTELKFRYQTLQVTCLHHRSENLSFPAIGNSGSGRSLSPAALRID